MNNKDDKNTSYSPFRNPFSFGKKQRLSVVNNIDNKESHINVDKKNVEDKEINIKKPKNKKSNLHAKKSFSISISTNEYEYWKKVAQMNKKSVSALVRDIVNQHTEYEGN